MIKPLTKEELETMSKEELVFIILTLQKEVEELSDEVYELGEVKEL